MGSRVFSERGSEEVGGWMLSTDSSESGSVPHTDEHVFWMTPRPPHPPARG